MNSVNILLAIATTLIPFTNAVVAVIKKAAPKIPSGYIPAVSVVVGALLGIAASFLPGANYGLVTLIYAGAISGFASCGVYDIVANNVGSNTPVKIGHFSSDSIENALVKGTISKDTNIEK